MPLSSTRHEQLHRFQRLGLRCNPFRVLQPSEKPGVYLPDLYDSTASAADIVTSAAPFTQIIADSGHGKSTLLAAVIAELDTADLPFAFHYLPPSLFARIATPSEDVRVLVIDEFERLTRWNRRRLRRWTSRGNRLIVSTHRDLSRGFSGETVTVRLPGLTADGLQHYFAQRIHWAGGDADQFELTYPATTWLLATTTGNLRVADAVLYEIFQQATPGERLVIDEQRLAPFDEFARQRTDFEALGNLPPTLFRRLRWAISEYSGRRRAKLPGRASMPDRAVRELPRRC